MTRPLIFACALSACALSGCTQPVAVARLGQPAPDWAEPGTCWDRLITPAIIETVTVQQLVEEAVVGAEGQVLKPATYRTSSEQKIVRDRTEDWFEILCAQEITPQFVASLQRALQVRGLYDGAISGQLDKPTRKAIRAYQAPRGVDSESLSLASARALGLIAVARE